MMHQGLEDEVLREGITITSWLGKENWKHGDVHPAAHPNSRCGLYVIGLPAEIVQRDND